MHLYSQVEATEWMLLCICVSVHVSVHKWLIFGTFMKFQSILVIFILRLFMHCGEFPRGYIEVDQVCLSKKFVVVRGFTKMSFSFIFVSSNVWTVFIG